MDPKQTFAELLARVREGQAEASESLVRAFSPGVRRAARVHGTGAAGQGRYDSEDLAQSAFLRLFAGLADGRLSFDTPDELAAWLIRVVRTRLSDRWRRERAGGVRHPTPKSAGELKGVAAASHEPDPAEVAEANDLLRSVGARLPPHDLAVLRLWLEGHGWDEIGRTLSQSPDAARKRLTRALAHLRDGFAV